MGGMLLGVYQEPGVEFEANHSRYLSPGKGSHSPCPYDAKEIGNAAIDGYQLHLLLRNGLLRKSRFKPEVVDLAQLADQSWDNQQPFPHFPHHHSRQRLLYSAIFLDR
jgi:hypothetical protein